MILKNGDLVETLLLKDINITYLEKCLKIFTIFTKVTTKL
jgi:hypothetical protein